MGTAKRPDDVYDFSCLESKESASTFATYNGRLCYSNLAVSYIRRQVYSRRRPNHLLLKQCLPDSMAAELSLVVLVIVRSFAVQVSGSLGKANRAGTLLPAK